jgi:hypothetical protein
VWCFRHDGLLGQFEPTLIRDMANSGLIFGITSFAKFEGAINADQTTVGFIRNTAGWKARQPSS